MFVSVVAAVVHDFVCWSTLPHNKMDRAGLIGGQDLLVLVEFGTTAHLSRHHVLDTKPPPRKACQGGGKKKGRGMESIMARRQKISE